VARTLDPGWEHRTYLVDGRHVFVRVGPEVPGAAPILHDGRCLGAIAVSGLTKELDGEFAQAGADALAQLLR